MDEAHQPPFLPFIDEYLRGVQGRLTQWTGRAFDQVRYQDILSIVRRDDGKSLSSG